MVTGHLQNKQVVKNITGGTHLTFPSAIFLAAC
jgi:hypothetical protein